MELNTALIVGIGVLLIYLGGTDRLKNVKPAFEVLMRK